MRDVAARGVFAAVLAAAAGIAAGAAMPPPDPPRTRVPVVDRLAPPRDDESCGLDPVAQRLAQMIRTHPLQARVSLRCSALLAQVAAQRAAEMARRGQVSHHYGVVSPNKRLRKAGYRLPTSYPRMFDNQVEALAGGYATAEHALQAFLDSPPHRTHLLAENAFYAEQDEIGVGFARNPDSNHVDYWVVYIARRAEGGNPLSSTMVRSAAGATSSGGPFDPEPDASDPDRDR